MFVLCYLVDFCNCGFEGGSLNLLCVTVWCSGLMCCVFAVRITLVQWTFLFVFVLMRLLCFSVVLSLLYFG